MEELDIILIGDKVLIELTEPVDRTDSGLIVPDSAQSKSQKGYVRACGTAKDGKPLTVRVGDTVIFGKYAGTDVNLGDNKEYIIIREVELHAIIDRNKK